MNKVHCDVCDKPDAKRDHPLHVHEEDVLAVVPTGTNPRKIVALKELWPTLQSGTAGRSGATSDICDDCLELWLRALIHKYDRIGGVAP
jgi:hypothetical protein